MRSIYFLMQENIAFAKYSTLLNFLVHLGVATSVPDLPGNANLGSERTKDEIIQAIGM